jgi:copper(I)-binding protein
VLAMAGSAHAAGKLGVVDAWIRLAPPGASMLAGYATLSNTGDAPITVLTVQSDAFRMASLCTVNTVIGASPVFDNVA